MDTQDVTSNIVDSLQMAAVALIVKTIRDESRWQNVEPAQNIVIGQAVGADVIKKSRWRIFFQVSSSKKKKAKGLLLHFITPSVQWAVLTPSLSRCDGYIARGGLLRRSRKSLAYIHLRAYKRSTKKEKGESERRIYGKIFFLRLSVVVFIGIPHPPFLPIIKNSAYMGIGRPKPKVKRDKGYVEEQPKNFCPVRRPTKKKKVESFALLFLLYYMSFAFNIPQGYIYLAQYKTIRKEKKVFLLQPSIFYNFSRIV